MSTKLFNDFTKISSKEWKNKIQYELKGADYNDTLVWESPEGIKVKPFYHCDEDNNPVAIHTETTNFKIVQELYTKEEALALRKALEVLDRGAETLRFIVPSPSTDMISILKVLPGKEGFDIYIDPLFLDLSFIQNIDSWCLENQRENIKVFIDPVGQLYKDGNWFTNLEQDFKVLSEALNSTKVAALFIDNKTIQNAGANTVQQLAYTLAHVNEYFNRLSALNTTIYIDTAVSSNYFFEIAKTKALRLLFDLLKKEYNDKLQVKLFAKPSKRNKTLYDYNVNLLRTTTECMSAILGGADYVTNFAYDGLYHKENEFGDRIARNQLLILKQESYFDQVNNPTEGSYYIENLTRQLAEKALVLFKDIERGGGFITQLIEGNIQRKIKESAEKEQSLFDEGKEILLGTNKYPNPQDKMKHELELFPFLKQKPRKTLVSPILEKRLAEKLEQQRLEGENDQQ